MEWNCSYKGRSSGTSCVCSQTWSVLGCLSAFKNFSYKNNRHSVPLSVFPSLSVTVQVFPEGTRPIIAALAGQVAVLNFSKLCGLQINIRICTVLCQTPPHTFCQPPAGGTHFVILKMAVSRRGRGRMQILETVEREMGEKK